MPILPVLDLMQGQIVRGVAGRRDEYRPIVSRLVDSSEPIAVARALRRQFGFVEFYLADLDAIQLGTPAFGIYRRLYDDGFRLWIDAGVRTSQDDVLTSLIEIDSATVVAGLESVEGPEELQGIIRRVGVARVVLSLDLKAGQPLGRVDLWSTRDPWAIAARAIAAIGVRRLIVLDLARVGVGAGIGTDDLCRRLKQAYPEVQLTAGGGVRGTDDVKRLLDMGVDHVLVASALHDGDITAEDLQWP